MRRTRGGPGELGAFVSEGEDHDQFATVLTLDCLIEFLYQAGSHEPSGDICQRALLHKSLILFVSQSTTVLYNRTCTPFAPVGSTFSHLYRGLQ